MKVIFLDFDGVLNNYSSGFLSILETRGKGLFMGIAAPNATSVRLLDILLSLDYNIQIVVSSSWRHGRTVEELINILQDEFKLTRAHRVIDKTRNTDMNEDRGHQIDDWLNSHKEVTEYVIIDDSTDMLPHHENNFVNTTLELGFGKDDFKKACEILKVNYEY